MTNPTAHQEPYTKYPNRYNDVIKPQLTDTQRDICDVVIRMTYGWHKTSAAIPNSMFAEKSNKSIQGVIKAKKQLEDMGLLVVLEKGGGSKTGVYMLDLYYDDLERAVKASTLPQEEQLMETENSSLPEEDISQEVESEMEVPAVEIESPMESETSVLEENQLPQQDILESPTAPIMDESVISQEPLSETEPPPEEPASQEQPVEDPTAEPGISSEENHIPAAAISEPDPPTPQQEISDTAEAVNPDVMEVFESPTPKLSLPPPIYSINNIPGKKRKQTMGPNTEESKKKKNAAAAVRFRFLSIFPEARDDDDWGFFGWVARDFGLEACLEKLNYMAEHRKQHTITNPKGFFRMALVKDYQLPARAVAKIKADERARRSVERARKERKEWDKKVASFNYESAMASVQNILDMLG